MRQTKFSMSFLENFTSKELEEFLEQNQESLHEEMISSSLNRLRSYLKNSEQAPMYLQIGLIMIQVEGTEEATIAKKLLSEVLMKQFQK